MNTFLPIDLEPNHITAHTGRGTLRLARSGSDYAAEDLMLRMQPAQDGSTTLWLSAQQTSVEHLHLRWQVPIPGNLRILGDAWERAYGDLEWRGIVPERILPWYAITYDGQTTRCFGVKTGASALCFWRIDPSGISLWLDVRCGGLGVELRGRELRAAVITGYTGQPGESPFTAAATFCKRLCAAPRLPEQPVYGSNNWYYAYSVSTQEDILNDTRLLVDLAPTGSNRPYMVIDAGWQPLCGDGPEIHAIVGGPYTGANARYPDMPALAERMQQLGARPGIWMRPLAAYPEDAPSMLLPVARAVDASAKIPVLDPSIPDVLERIRADVQEMTRWGYALVKHDWSACDLFGRWGFQMGAALTNPGWRFADPTRTTAEITLALYQAIRDGAGRAVVIGCNTVGHLAAGLFELQRIGDDTSGREWERTRKYGINALAFRAAQHNAFFAADPDCVGHTARTPWALNRQFLDLVARSGMPLFASVDPKVTGPEEAAALRSAYAAAAQPQATAEPLDWLDSTCPRRWKMGDSVVEYTWMPDDGVPLHTGSIPLWWG